MEEEKIATPEETRRLREAEQWEESRPVKMPKCKLTYLIRRPTKRYWMERRATWPAEMLERLDAYAAGNVAAEFTPEDIIIWLRERSAMEDAAFVAPRAAQNPDCTEIAIRWLPNEDQEFLHKYLSGEVNADNMLRSTFRGGESRDIAHGGNPGATVPPPAERDVAPVYVGLAD